MDDTNIIFKLVENVSCIVSFNPNTIGVIYSAFKEDVMWDNITEYKKKSFKIFK